MRRWPIAGSALAALVAGVTIAGAVTALGSGESAAVPAPTLVARTARHIVFPGAAPRLSWPSAGQAAVEVEGIGSLGTSGALREAPIASVAKIMTAYLVLTDHPLPTGADGPVLTVSRADAADYVADVARNESVVPVRAGERLTERQALEALLLPSADNIAMILARWDAGSVDAFVARMNAVAARFGMTHTRYTDPSGLAPSTVSTAPDQVRMGQAAMRVPALAGIADMSTARIPVAGTVRNYNGLLGDDGVVGLKTGSTHAAGGCLVFAARATVGGRSLTIIGAVLGQPGTPSTILPHALAAGRRLVASAEDALSSTTLVDADTTVAVVRNRPHPDVALAPARPVTAVGWPGLAYTTTVGGTPRHPTLTVAGPATTETVPLTPHTP